MGPDPNVTEAEVAFRVRVGLAVWAVSVVAALAYIPPLASLVYFLSTLPAAVLILRQRHTS